MKNAAFKEWVNNHIITNDPFENAHMMFAWQASRDATIKECLEILNTERILYRQSMTAKDLLDVIEYEIKNLLGE